MESVESRFTTAERILSYNLPHLMIRAKFTSAKNGGCTRPLQPLRRGYNIYKLDNLYFIKSKTSVNIVNSNAIISAVEACAGQGLVEF